MLAEIGITLGHVETAAWKRRNIAAHGGEVDLNSVIPTIMETKLLKIILHRIVLKTTGASEATTTITLSATPCGTSQNRYRRRHLRRGQPMSGAAIERVREILATVKPLAAGYYRRPGSHWVSPGRLPNTSPPKPLAWCWRMRAPPDTTLPPDPGQPAANLD